MQLNGKLDRHILANGVEMPCLGFGMYMMPANDKGASALTSALELGLCHIDGAGGYGNEAMEGDVLRASKIFRNELFLTGKLQNGQQGYRETYQVFEATCTDLGTAYLDLYLIHWPKVAGYEDEWERRITETWRTFEELYRAGRIRAIGVSNFLVSHLKVLCKHATIPPMVDQLELNPSYRQAETVAWCEERGIQLEAWAPLGRGKLLRYPTVVRIAQRYGKEVGQVCVRWSLQHGYAIMPKSINPQRLRSNSEVFTFELSEDDMCELDTLDGPDNYTFHPDRLEEWAIRVAQAHAESGV